MRFAIMTSRMRAPIVGQRFYTFVLDYVMSWMPDNKCDICGTFELLPFKCRYCGGTFCSAHRLPENHSCPGLKMLKQRPTGETQRKVGAQSRHGKLKLPRVKLPYSGYYAYAIIGLTVLVYILQLVFRPGFTNLFELSNSTLMSRPWGVITSIFLHDPNNIMHLFLNMLMLFFFGPLLERRIGSGKFLGIYLGSGILAGLVQVLVFPGAVIGASGALMGVMGMLTVLMPDIKVILYFVPLKLVYVTILFTILDLYPVLQGSSDGVAHIAHLTGLAAGLAAGYYYKKTNRTREIYWQV